MNTLIVFSEALNLPVGDSKRVKTYGLVLSKDSWQSTPYKDAFMDYVRTIDLMYKYGFKTNGGMEFEKNEMFVYYGDMTWRAFEAVVKICGVQYAIVGDCVGLDKSDYTDELFTNQQKWSELVGKEGLVWQR
ncbi:MAG: hypothetical protein IKQ20_00095 [Bacteroidales bacterium]|jgi:hypothetical protein|nr:hypothetical protein [Bacteroidales bacterium]